MLAAAVDTITKRCISLYLPTIKLVDEIIIVDTGSTDDTINLILQHSAKIKLYSYPWNNDFSEVRNYAISLATTEWCLIIDADECIAGQTKSTFSNIIQKINHEDKYGLYAPLIDNLDGSQLKNNARIFRKRSTLRYHGKVHEYLIEAQESKIISLPTIKILHSGYINDAWKLKNKSARNKTLLQQQIVMEPDNLRWKYFLLRYVEPSTPEHEEILQHFGSLPLPYEDDWEVYAFNVKSKLIISLLHRGAYQQAWEHAQTLYGFYTDRDTRLLYLVTNYLNSKNNLIKVAQRSNELFGELHLIQRDTYLSEKLHPDSYQNILNEISSIAVKRTTEIF